MSTEGRALAVSVVPLETRRDAIVHIHRRTLARQGYAAEGEAVVAANPPSTAPVVPRSAEARRVRIT